MWHFADRNSMMRKLVVIAALLSTPALAQQQYTMTLTPQQLQTILDSMTEVKESWRVTNPVIATLLEQMRAQQAVAAKPPVPAAPVAPLPPPLQE
jgi:hypothetical protein